MDKKEIFLDKADKIHKGKYDYSKVEYIDAKTKVCIICSEHGEFWQTPDKHINAKQGCPICANKQRKDSKVCGLDVFLKRAHDVHKDKYDYSKIKEYVNNNTKMPIICRKHGVFYQDMVHHIDRGQGCPICAIERQSERQKLSFEEYISKANTIHGNKYEYIGEYNGTKSKIHIKCPIHGVFEQEAESHLQGCGCPKCSSMFSKAENEIYDYVCSLVGNENVTQKDHSVLGGKKELDIYVPSMNIAIEYNGLRWHSEKFGKGRYYHLDKLESCNKNSIKLLQIFEDEYISSKDIVFSKIKTALGCNDGFKISARKCEIHEIDNIKAKEFLNLNHIQGFNESSLYLGCYYDNSLIGVMTFTEEMEHMWNLTRFATQNGYICRGVGGKLFKYFVRKYNPEEVKSFADRRWTTDENDNLYTKLGFTLDKVLKPDYKYFKEDCSELKRHHKFGFRKQILHKKYGMPLSMTERKMTKELGYTRIWDCGLLKYVWRK